MPQPVPQDVHVDTLLTNVLVAYMQMPDAYVADEVFPVIRVDKESGKIPKWTKEDFFRDLAEIRAPGTESHGGGFTAAQDSFLTLNYATHIDIDDETRAMQDSPYNIEEAASELIATRLRMRREKSFADDFFKTGVWGTDRDLSTDPNDQWNDFGLSDPINDVETSREAIHSVTAREPNDVLMGRQVWTKLKQHPALLERIKYTQAGVITMDLVAALFDLERILLGRAIQATNTEGQAATFSYVFGKHCLFTFGPRRASLLVPAAGYTFHWSRFGALSFVRRLRNDFTQVWRLEGHTYYDQKLIGADCGYFLQNAVA